MRDRFKVDVQLEFSGSKTSWYQPGVVVLGLEESIIRESLVTEPEKRLLDLTLCLESLIHEMFHALQDKILRGAPRAFRFLFHHYGEYLSLVASFSLDNIVKEMEEHRVIPEGSTNYLQVYTIGLFASEIRELAKKVAEAKILSEGPEEALSFLRDVFDNPVFEREDWKTYFEDRARELKKDPDELTDKFEYRAAFAEVIRKGVPKSIEELVGPFLCHKAYSKLLDRLEVKTVPLWKVITD